jgi:hypothetical protein
MSNQELFALSRRLRGKSALLIDADLDFAHDRSARGGRSYRGGDDMNTAITFMGELAAAWLALEIAAALSVTALHGMRRRLGR